MYTSIDFLKAWSEWKEHKQEKFGLPYTAVAERKALAALWQKSHGIEQLAIDSIDYSIENNWSAIYIKPKDNNGTGTTATKQEFRAGVNTEFNSRYGNGR